MNKLTISILAAAALLIAAPVTLTAQSRLGAIGVDTDFSLQNNRLSVAIDVALQDAEIASQATYIYTPVIVSNQTPESDRVELPPFMVVGKRRAMVLERRRRYGNRPRHTESEPAYTLVRVNGTPQKIAYVTETAYLPWMSDARLELRESVRGCASCDRGVAAAVYADRIVTPPYRPSYTVTMLQPEVERIKRRSDSFTATIAYPVNVAELRREYQNNSAVIGEIDQKVGAITANPDLTVTEVTIAGYASPEASAAYNKSLSERRAQALADYMGAKLGISRAAIRVTASGEDWAEARRLIEASDLPRRAEVLAIIDRETDPDARDGEIRALDGGATYARLLTEIWPAIRRTVYTVAYTVRGFDVEEAKRLLATNPKLLSLHEIYLVAGTYEADSKEYLQVFDIASRLFPNDPIALMNASASDLKEGAYAEALRRLEPLKEDPRAWNNLGIAYARLGRYDEAKRYFQKAIADGSDAARHNLAEVERAAETADTAL
ncbi:MAG: OmpA family protein [Porphyromonas sp.]|nr:OmpA family protein [Porphyromonas sp.]